MVEAPTTSDLFETRAISYDEVNAAADAYLVRPARGLVPIAKDYLLDIAAAVEACEFARWAMASGAATDHMRRAAVRTAILMARPVQV